MIYTDRHIGFEIRTLNNMIKRRMDEQFKSDGADGEGLTIVQSWVVGYLYNHRDEDVYQKDLEAAFKMSRSTATGILKLMEKSGLIFRTAEESDARLKRLELTQEGLRRHMAFLETASRLESRLACGLSDNEIESFFATAHKMERNLEEMETGVEVD